MAWAMGRPPLLRHGRGAGDLAEAVEHDFQGDRRFAAALDVLGYSTGILAEATASPKAE
ncbi:MAG: hypothetical protein J0M02_14065 [Planctomycetes bacterium]|nr:hypothetical protein [Planctomycetota bacterium]